MPRRRALGVLGVALAGLATGGSATGGRIPFGTRQSRGCGAAFKVCEPTTQACFAHCCPKHTVCSFSARGKNGCQERPGCCDPCNRERSQPDGQGGCRPGPIPAHCPCRSDQKRCNAGMGHGVVCCENDEYCATSGKDEGSGSSVTGTCCKKGQAFCLRGSPARAFCCPRGTRCCNAGAGGGTGGLIGGVCCSRLTQVCQRGVCRCKPGHTVDCGKDCCHPRLHKCCGTARKRCVPKDVDCDDAFPNT